MINKTIPRKALAALALCIASAMLSGCVGLIIGGAAVGTLVALDRRTTGAQLEDEGIELRSGNRIRNALGDRVHVNTTSYNRQVLLTGEVPDEATRQNIEQIVASVENVRGVVNDLAVMGQSSLPQRSADALVTGKVKATLVDARDLTANAFKVVTERGAVYLMGRVTQREADRATQLTRTVGGVSRVVRVFELISEEELARIAPTPASTRAAGD